MTDTGLTTRQQQILDLIRERVATTGLPPTRAEIRQAFGFASPNAAEGHLRALARKGAIELSEGIARGIRLLEAAGLPLVGRVAAGQPILAEQHIQGRCQIDPDLFRPRADYLLTVRGMSMRDIGILEGDLLAVHRTAEARHGQVVVARLHDEVTVKRFERRGERIRLLPENPDFEPILVDPARDNFAIEGLAVGVIRNGSLP